MPWWHGGLRSHAASGSAGTWRDAATAAAGQRSTPPSRRRQALSTSPQPQRWAHDSAVAMPTRLQRWQLQAYNAYHQSGITLRMGLEFRSLAQQYIVREAVLLDLVQQWTARNPRVPLGNADMNRSSKAWDAIAIAALGTELQGLFPTALCAMYCAIDSERKLAAGIASSHHRKDQPSHSYSKRQAACDAAVTAAWAAQRTAQQAAARRREAARQTQEVDDRVRLGRARRTVAAAERALHTLEQQVAAAWVSPALLPPAEAAAAEARAALAAGRRHLAHLEQAVAAAGGRSRAESQQRPSGSGWQYGSPEPAMHSPWQQWDREPGQRGPPAL